MKFDILTLFPEMFEGIKYSIIGKAIEKEIAKKEYANTEEEKAFAQALIDGYEMPSKELPGSACDENAEIVFPKQIKVIKEVTEDETYKNASLAAI